MITLVQQWAVVRKRGEKSRGISSESDAEALVLRVVNERQAQVDVGGAAGGPVLATARPLAAVSARELQRATEKLHKRARHWEPETVPTHAIKHKYSMMSLAELLVEKSPSRWEGHAKKPVQPPKSREGGDESEYEIKVTWMGW